MKWILLVLVLTGTLLTPVNGAAKEVPSVLVLGAISDDPNKQYAAMRPIADYIQQALQPMGVETIEVLIVPNRGQMVRLMRDGRIDWVSETPFGAVHLQQRANAAFLARKWKDGIATYHSVFFARKDSGVKSIEDLNSQLIAFEHRNSTSGFFMPASMITRAELTLEGLATPREKAPEGTCSYVYSGSEYNSAVWVHKGLVNAGVLSNADWDDPIVMPSAILDDLEIFARSEEMPRAVEVVRADLDEGLRDALFAALTAMHDQQDAAEALQAYDNTARFDALTDADMSVLTAIADALPAFRAEFP